MKNLNGFDWIVFLLLIIGGLNWGMIAAFDIDIVSSIFGVMTITARIVHGLVGLSALYSVYILIAKTE